MGSQGGKISGKLSENLPTGISFFCRQTPEREKAAIQSETEQEGGSENYERGGARKTTMGALGGETGFPKKENPPMPLR
jgi:hypothetical protein